MYVITFLIKIFEFIKIGTVIFVTFKSTSCSEISIVVYLWE